MPMIHVYRWAESSVEMCGSDYRTGALDDTGWVWVDVVGESPATIREIGAVYGLDDNAVEESLVSTDLPLVEEHVREVLVVLHGFATGKGERLSTPQMVVFLGEGFLITIRDGERATIEQIKERLADEGALPVSSPAAFLAFIALIAGRRHMPLIQELERQVDGLEEMAIRGDPLTAVEVQALRRDVILLKRALGPQFDVYEDLADSTHPAVDGEARQLFARVAGQHRRSLESLEAGRALLGFVLETYRGAVADQTNEIMRVLTAFAAIPVPRAVISGAWGRNFASIPGADASWGFWGLTAIMAIVAIGVWIYFARRGFIGAPRVKDLPRAVGLGLFHIGTAPIRAVAGGVRQWSGSGD